MTSALVLALTWAMVAPNAAAYCTVGYQRSVRPRSIMEMILRATPDSVRDDHPPRAGANGMFYHERLHGDTGVVYAQVFELLSADGELGPLRPQRHRRVALVWWQLATHCQRVTPGPAVQRDIDDLFLIARATDWRKRWPTGEFDDVYTDLRPRSEWIRGMPTFDVSFMAWSYSPRFQRVGKLPGTIRGDLTVAEYRDFFAHLPLSGDTRAEMDASRRRLLRWADADSRRWTLYPAALELCGLEVALTAVKQSLPRCEQ